MRQNCASHTGALNIDGELLEWECIIEVQAYGSVQITCVAVAMEKTKTEPGDIQ